MGHYDGKRVVIRSAPAGVTMVSSGRDRVGRSVRYLTTTETGTVYALSSAPRTAHAWNQ
jgi:hypothetical protein